jgi:muramoyltetrapeptide carboxypeptidase
MMTSLPPAVTPGDRVGVAALSGPVEAEKLELGLERLRELGFEPTVAGNVGASSGLFAGNDAERLEGFHRLAADPEIKAIFFARGGHGALRLLSAVDWPLLERHPRAYVGYSDVTLFLNQVVKRLGLVAFHGPMVAVDLARELEPAERRSLLGALAGVLPAQVEVEPVSGGPFDVSGPLVGGCLSLIASGLGTAHQLPTAGSILFWEDVHEPLYRLDRMLTQLRLSGTLADINGMVVGRVEPADQGASTTDFHQLLKELNSDRDWPISVGCASGHCEPNMTLGLGLPARLQSSPGRLVMG